MAMGQQHVIHSFIHTSSQPATNVRMLQQHEQQQQQVCVCRPSSLTRSIDDEELNKLVSAPADPTQRATPARGEEPS